MSFKNPGAAVAAPGVEGIAALRNAFGHWPVQGQCQEVAGRHTR
ncbi:hypothetical protein [Diaphorobacter aerolatus]|nr:hypothetical protein [Diaphorobacter aerolatus]